MGTPAFAVPSIKALLTNGFHIVLVITQPDKPKGRGGRITPPPVKEFAVSHGIPVLQPERLKEPVFLDRLRKAAPDAVVVAAYGKILPPDILTLPRLGCINVHASLLPKYRGAAPVQWALMNGECETGVTIMLMDEGMDTGDILLQQPVPILSDENSGSLSERLSRLGAELLIETLRRLEGNRLKRHPQDHSLASYAPPLTPSDEVISWNLSAETIRNKVRALDPQPGARTLLSGRLLKIWRVSVKTGDFSGEPGEILEISDEGIIVRAGEGAVMVHELQLAGGRRLSAAAFLRGHQLRRGNVLGVCKNSRGMLRS